jgi:hypothetical protein
MQLHQDGWRAEFALPLVIWIDAAWPDEMQSPARTLAASRARRTTPTLKGLVAIAQESAQAIDAVE